MRYPDVNGCSSWKTIRLNNSASVNCSDTMISTWKLQTLAAQLCRPSTKEHSIVWCSICVCRTCPDSKCSKDSASKRDQTICPWSCSQDANFRSKKIFDFTN